MMDASLGDDGFGTSSPFRVLSLIDRFRNHRHWIRRSVRRRLGSAHTSCSNFCIRFAPARIPDQHNTDAAERGGQPGAHGRCDADPTKYRGFPMSCLRSITHGLRKSSRRNSPGAVWHQPTSLAHCVGPYSLYELNWVRGPGVNCDRMWLLTMPGICASISCVIIEQIASTWGLCHGSVEMWRNTTTDISDERRTTPHPAKRRSSRHIPSSLASWRFPPPHGPFRNVE